jgi:hypothetical protein
MVEDAALPNASCPAGDNVFLWIIAPDSDVGRRRNVEDVAAPILQHAILDVTKQIVRFSKLSNLPVTITGE